MPIYPSHRAVFVHIPKTGGSTITTLLKRDSFLGRKKNEPDPRDGGRETVAEFLAMLGDEAEDYFTFSFVRNPWDRFVSAYHYVCQKRSHMTCVTSHESFSDFVTAFASDPEKFLDIRYFRPQYSYLGNSEGLHSVDFVGRFEHFEDDLQKVLKQIGIRRRLMRHRKRTNRADYRQYFGVKERDAIADVYSNDIEHFDYAFEDGNTRKKTFFLKVLQ